MVFVAHLYHLEMLNTILSLTASDLCVTFLSLSSMRGFAFVYIDHVLLASRPV